MFVVRLHFLNYFFNIFFIVYYWHCLHSTHSRIYEAVVSMHLSSDPQQQPATAGLLLWAQRAGDIAGLLQQWRANAGTATLSAYVVAVQPCLHVIL